MLSKSQIKYIRTLQLKKFRLKHGAFIAEGEKLIDELLTNHCEFHTIFALSEWIEEHNLEIEKRSIDCQLVSEKELYQISGLKTPNRVVGILKIPSHQIEEKLSESKIYLVLDDIRDPGNMGTIIRTADWFGFQSLFCSHNCVDVYNPKVVQATMGAIASVKVYQADLNELFQKNSEIPVYGAVLDGQSIYNIEPVSSAFVVFGNESKGISSELRARIDHPITIPAYGKSESLNAAMSVGIILSELRRRNSV